MLTDQESEMLGIMFGDGSLSKVGGSVQIAITGNKTDDKEYLLEHASPLFARLFGIDLRTRYRRGEKTMDLYIYSKKVAFMLHEWGMPIGLKNVGELRPRASLNEKSFIRGLFDTDGCVYRKYEKYAQIQFKSASATLMEYLMKCLNEMRFHPTSMQRDDTRYKFYLCRQAEIDKFFEIIAPANVKHLKRFKEIREHVPLSIKTGSRM
jgi:DNA-binding transcriptional regulator WhiA